MHEWTKDGSGGHGQRTAAADNGRQRRTRTTDGSGGQRTAAADKGRQRRTRATDGGGRQRTAATDNGRQRRTRTTDGGADKGRQRQTTDVSGRQRTSAEDTDNRQQRRTRTKDGSGGQRASAADNRRRGTPLASVAGHRHQFVEENRYSQMQWRITTCCSGSGWGPISVWVRGFRRGCRRGRWPGG